MRCTSSGAHAGSGGRKQNVPEPEFSRVQRARDEHSVVVRAGSHSPKVVASPAPASFQEKNVNRIQRSIMAVAAAGGLAWASMASAQLAVPLNKNPDAAFAGFPLQNPAGPAGTNYQTNYPYPGQCIADPANGVLFPTLKHIARAAASARS
jgi:hypothetical protein